MKSSLGILAYAYVFPPDAGSGTYRTLHFVNRWARRGDSVTVITVRLEDFSATATVDHDLCRSVEPQIRVVRARAFRPLQALIKLRNRGVRNRAGAYPASALKAVNSPSERTGLLGRGRRAIAAVIEFAFGFPDEHSGWIPSAVRLGMRLSKTQAFDCIYASGGPWSTLLAATITHKLTGLPLILDFRDPWASNPNYQKRSPALRRLHARVESYCVAAARRIILNTESLREDFVLRYPHIDLDRFICITNGFEEIPSTEPEDSGKLTIVHAGTLYLSRNPGRFLQALLELIEANHIPPDDIRVRFIGGMAQDPHLDRIIARLGEVVEILPRLPHAEALRHQQRASALLLFQAGLPLQVPRKLYEYFALGRAIVAITDAGSATDRILRDVGASYVSEDDVTGIKEVLLRLYSDWNAGQPVLMDQERLQNYSNRRLAERLRSELSAALEAS
ncbi:MAG: glycosyltransferase [Steroidobacteraceae bacterium]|jgi:hypothetical protein|nr:glycosyltransferase [Steroidobacteraceae bacterium]